MAYCLVPPPPKKKKTSRKPGSGSDTLADSFPDTLIAYSCVLSIKLYVIGFVCTWICSHLASKLTLRASCMKQTQTTLTLSVASGGVVGWPDASQELRTVVIIKGLNVASHFEVFNGFVHFCIRMCFVLSCKCSMFRYWLVLTYSELFMGNT